MFSIVTGSAETYVVEQVSTVVAVTEDELRIYGQDELTKLVKKQAEERIMKEILGKYGDAFQIEHEFDIVSAQHMFSIRLKILVPKKE